MPNAVCNVETGVTGFTRGVSTLWYIPLRASTEPFDNFTILGKIEGLSSNVPAADRFIYQPFFASSQGHKILDRERNHTLS